MRPRSNSTFTYKNIAIATLSTGVVLAIFGFAMGGFSSIAWASVIGAGIALIFHGSILCVGVFLSSLRPKKE